ncbi:sugar isomerase domain-containing protein [Egibacter rhizosphaerae]|uniref:Sugar isomerase domain-containing protein n=1 Tax=Egibacter rhizosphaerae TaxID=1670831 RepID=A0A411YEQ9_9ACTN|nr:SIS domain-containing protein [Egibacter rhizosphaerae]QBI19686.1 sugar isomerase domain-containing protein [Egibacter rhizosphaerae]
MPSPESAHPYVAGVVDRLLAAAAEQDTTLRSCAEQLADRVRDGGVLHVFGTGHSHIVAEELFARAGGPAFVNPILDETLMLHAGGGLSTRAERLPGYARVVLDGHDLRPGDALLVVSNSGRNAVPVEAALRGRELGLLTLALTSFGHSSSVTSRHGSGQRLMDVVDVALDNRADPGDGQLELPGSGARYGPTSTVVGTALAQTLVCMVVETLDGQGHTPPLIRSANLDDSDEQNRARKAPYLDRIPALR